ncbi:MAG TPA: hypothetical protein VFS00_26995, partial [Polyangiaceae bacterium]|nr:hypothetical protein [Polyangiaceae bacterium]
MTTDQAFRAIDADGRAANYLTVGQLYLQESSRLRNPLRPEHIEPRLLAHCDKSPGLSLVDVRPDRPLREQGVSKLRLASPGREGPAVFTNVYLEGGYSDRCSAFHQDVAGPRRWLSPLSTPGGASSHDQRPQWLGVEATGEHSLRGALACPGAKATRGHGARGASVWAWASSDEAGEPDVVLACAGDVATLETVAAAKWLREQAPGLNVRVVNVVDLMALSPPEAHPHGMAEARFVELFP